MSEVQKLILEALGEGVARRSNRLTVRLTDSELARLLVLVDAMKTTKTVLGEKILGAAISDAFLTYVETLDEHAADQVYIDIRDMEDAWDLARQNPDGSLDHSVEVAA